MANGHAPTHSQSDHTRIIDFGASVLGQSRASRGSNDFETTGGLKAAARPGSMSIDLAEEAQVPSMRRKRQDSESQMMHFPAKKPRIHDEYSPDDLEIRTSQAKSNKENDTTLASNPTGVMFSEGIISKEVHEDILQAKRNEYNEYLSKHRSRNKELNQAKADSDARVAQLEGKIEQVEERIKQLDSKLGNTEAERDKLQMMALKWKTRYDQQITDEDHWWEQMTPKATAFKQKEIEDEVKESKAEYEKKHKKKLSDLQKKVDKHETQIADDKDKILALKSDNTNLTKRNKELERDLKKGDSKRAKESKIQLTNELNDKNKELAEQRKQLSNHDAQIGTLTRENSVLRHDCVRYKGERNQLSEHVRRLEATTKAAKDRTASWKAKYENSVRQSGNEQKKHEDELQQEKKKWALQAQGAETSQQAVVNQHRQIAIFRDQNERNNVRLAAFAKEKAKLDGDILAANARIAELEAQERKHQSMIASLQHSNDAKASRGSISKETALVLASKARKTATQPKPAEQDLGNANSANEQGEVSPSAAEEPSVPRTRPGDQDLDPGNRGESLHQASSFSPLSNRSSPVSGDAGEENQDQHLDFPHQQVFNQVSGVDAPDSQHAQSSTPQPSDADQISVNRGIDRPFPEFSRQEASEYDAIAQMQLAAHEKDSAVDGFSVGGTGGQAPGEAYAADSADDSSSGRETGEQGPSTPVKTVNEDFDMEDDESMPVEATDGHFGEESKESKADVVPNEDAEMTDDYPSEVKAVGKDLPEATEGAPDQNILANEGEANGHQLDQTIPGQGKSE